MVLSFFWMMLWIPFQARAGSGNSPGTWRSEMVVTLLDWKGLGRGSPTGAVGSTGSEVMAVPFFSNAVSLFRCGVEAPSSTLVGTVLKLPRSPTLLAVPPPTRASTVLTKVLAVIPVAWVDSVIPRGRLRLRSGSVVDAGLPVLIPKPAVSG